MMESEMDRRIGWEALAARVNQSSSAERRRIRELLRAFAHDMRQTVGQVEAAEKLLRRLSGPELDADAWLEMLDVIKAANVSAQAILGEFVVHLIESIDPE